MVAFNPDVKEQQLPHYWYWSKPLEKQAFAAPEGNRIAAHTEADTSKGAMLTGVGDILASGMKAADAVVDSSAKFEADQASREERAKRTAELSDASGSLIAGDRPDQEKINRDLAPLNILKGARANGHLSDTDYWMRVDARLSDIRSRYPVAYRDDIDNTSTKILGENAANAVVRSRTADLNAALAAQTAEKNKTVSRLDRANDDGLQYASAWKQDYLAGKIDGAEVDKRLGAAYAPFFKQKLLDAQVKTLQAQGQITAAGNLSMDGLQSRAETTSQQYWTHYDEQTGMNASKADSLKLNSQEATQRYEWVKVQEAQYRQRMQQILTEPRDELGGRSYLQVHGKAATDEVIERGAARFKVEEGILADPNYGAIHRSRKMIDAANSDFAEAAFGIPSLKDFYLKNTYATKELGGADAAKKLFDAQLEKMPGMVNDLANIDTTLRFGAQPGEPVRPAVDSFKALSTSKAVTPEAYNKVATTIVDVALSPTSSPAAKSKAIDSVYDPSNDDFMGILTKPSQLPMFNLFTNKSFTDLVRAQGTDQQNLNMTNWANRSFSNMVSGDVKELTSIQDISGVKILWYKPEDGLAPRFGFTIGDDKRDAMTYDPTSKTHKGVGGDPATQATRIRETIGRLNGGVRGLYNVYNNNTSDVEASIFQMLNKLGFNPNPDKVENLPEALAKSITSSRQEQSATQKKIKELEK